MTICEKIIERSTKALYIGAHGIVSGAMTGASIGLGAMTAFAFMCGEGVTSTQLIVATTTATA